MLIGITGNMGAGKSTAGKILSECYGYRPMSFAFGVRREVSDALRAGKLPDELPDDLAQRIRIDAEAIDVWAKPTTPTARRLLQWWGTDYRRAHDPDYWVREFERRLAGLALRPWDCVQVDDLRFPNEAELIWRRGGYVWRIEGRGDGDGHPSETSVALIEPDRAIDNSGSITALRREICRLHYEIMGRYRMGERWVA